MNTNIEPTILQRLAFIKNLYELGVRQAKLPRPLSAMSVLTLHDAIEMFLHLTCVHLEIRNAQANTSFDQYWAKIRDGSDPSIDLGHEFEMKKLNRTRVNLKHHGEFPTEDMIARYTTLASEFLEESTPLVFGGILLAEVSMIEYVFSEKAKIHLRRADAHLAKGNTRDAAIEVAISFEALISDYLEHITGKAHGHPFYFGHDVQTSRYVSSSRLRSGTGDLVGEQLALDDLGELVGSVSESLGRIQDALRILALGLDYRKYARFRQLTVVQPRKMSNGEFHVDIGPVRLELNGKEMQFCIDYVIECSLILRDTMDSVATSFRYPTLE